MSRLVLLADLLWARPKDPPISLAAASLVASLKASTRAEVRSLTTMANGTGVSPEDLAESILEQSQSRAACDVDVAIGVYVWADSFVCRLIERLRSRGFTGRIILGGPQITYAGVGVERLYPGADAFVRGHGESALCALADNRGSPCVRGVHYAGSVDPGEQACTDLASLPSPWLDGSIPLRPRAFIRWETQRGCPYACSFCQHRDPNRRQRNSSFSWNRLLAEVDLFCDAGVDDIAVIDPVFHAGPHARAVLRRFGARGYRGRLSVQFRVS